MEVLYPNEIEISISYRHKSSKLLGESDETIVLSFQNQINIMKMSNPNAV